MNVVGVVERLKKEFPGKNIVLLPESNPTEIICEVEPTSEHPDYNMAVAVIDQSVLHKHEKAVENYEVLKGKLVVVAGKKRVTLKKGDALVIEPGTIHSAEGDETWVRVTSRPGWTPDDHILA